MQRILRPSMSVRERPAERVRAWGVDVEQTLETETSLIAFGRRSDQAVVVRIVKRPGDEWTAGEVLRAFDGRGVVRVYGCVEGALLLERITPGRSLVSLTVEGNDDDAIDIIADVIRQMSASTLPPICATVHDWANAFGWYSAGADRRIPQDLVCEAHHWFVVLASSQQNPRLLHGDLHHYNILFDSTRGWLAIDPKGVIGEAEYEIGAVLRNPIERPDLFVSSATIERRVARLATRLSIDFERTLAWGFAQAVLSAIWGVEDGLSVDATAPPLRLAHAIRVMLPPPP